MADMTAETREAFDDALRAGDGAHVLTVGSPERTALRVTVGRLDREGRWHPHGFDVFPIWRGCRREVRELASRAREDLNRRVASRLPRRLVLAAAMRVGVHATTGDYGDTVAPELPFMEALRRWPV